MPRHVRVIRPLSMKIESSRIEIVRDALRSPDDKLVDSISAWQAKGKYKRLSVSDAMKISGMKQEEASQNLMLLSTLTGGTIEVDDSGELIYAFPKDFITILRQRNLGSKLKLVQKKCAPAVMYATRVTFGLMLLTSLTIVATAMTAAASSSSSSSSGDRDDDRRSNRVTSRGGVTINLFGGGRRYGYGMGDFLFDFFYPRPYGYYYYERRGASSSGKDGVSLLESFFSFVFGDGDPNHNFESRRFQAIAEFIRSKDGVVVAEDLAPYMDPQLPPMSSTVAGLRREWRESAEVTRALAQAKGKSESSIIDESWVLPAVLQFGGIPEVTESGNIYYCFESLRKRKAASASIPIRGKTQELLQQELAEQREEEERSKLALWVEETPIPFSRASESQKVMAAVLGIANFGGVSWLGSFLRRNAINATGFYPFMVGYALLYMGMPLYRAMTLHRRNAKINTNNRNREMWSTYVHEAGDERLKSKLDDVAKHSRQIRPDSGSNRKRNVVYTTSALENEEEGN